MTLTGHQKKPYEKLKFYNDICEIRILVYHLTKRLERNHLRLVAQMRDAARSAKQNIREGYQRGSLGIFLNSIKISQGSLEELSGDMEDCLHDGLIDQEVFDKFMKLYRSAIYLSSRYIQSMYKNENKIHWRVPGKPYKP